jgi:hypothetical protein
MDAGEKTANRKHEVRRLMIPNLEQLDANLVEAIARRVVDLIGEATPLEDEPRNHAGGNDSNGTVRVLEEMLTPDEAAPVMRHSAKSVRALCRLPKSDPRYLRHLRKGAKILIRRSDIADWIAGQIGDD